MNVSGKPVVRTDPAHGTVQVTVRVPGTVESVWTALTKRDVAGRWFGDLSDDLAPGTNVRLDFGDADFFDIENVVFLPPGDLRYRWRFLGTGPQDQIAWKIAPQLEGGCSVSVTDSETSRSQQTIEELSSGWTDFLERLQRFLTHGGVTRYDWRRDFDGMVELPAPVDEARSLLFLGDSQPKWFPFGSIPLTSSPLAANAVDLQSDEAYVSDVEWKDDFDVTCQVTARTWNNPTNCRVEIVPRPGGSALVVRHTGWDGINSDPSYCMKERRKYGQRWIASLQKAKNLVEVSRCEREVQLQP
jgi:uncharacterized protein YndB with AHSA1/START domain